MRSLLLLLVAVLACSAAKATPTFDQFPAQRGTSSSFKVQLTSARSKQYASVLRAAAKQKPDFAGHYILASWGCGASCIMAAAIDAKNGAVSWLPFTVCCWDIQVTEPLEFRPDSRLLIVHGSRNEQGAGSDVHFYDFQGTQFRLLQHGP